MNDEPDALKSIAAMDEELDAEVRTMELDDVKTALERLKVDELATDTGVAEDFCKLEVAIELLDRDELTTVSDDCEDFVELDNALKLLDKFDAGGMTTVTNDDLHLQSNPCNTGLLTQDSNW